MKDSLRRLFPVHTGTAHIEEVSTPAGTFPRIVGEFWTSRQRQGHSLHEISYRACFKSQLPAYFIERLSKRGDTVYDPFCGRGTTMLETALQGRIPAGTDVNPLSRILILPRLRPPQLQQVEHRLANIPLRPKARARENLSMFFHPKTEAELVSLRDYVLGHDRPDHVDSWIRMVATNRLTGHSKGFFSVYSLPPNQAVTPERQTIINKRLRQKPEYRDTKQIILKKTASLLRSLTNEERSLLYAVAPAVRCSIADARRSRPVRAESVRLTVTSPPFLDVVDYASDNWMRCWFNGIDAKAVDKKISTLRSLAEWETFVGSVFRNLYRLTASGGWVCFEVGEVKKGSVKLDEHVIPLGIAAGFECAGVVVNRQSFTKTAVIWGVHNNRLGTNTNRIVLFRKS